MTASTPNPPRPTLITDPTLAPFLQPTFSPIDYLNSTLPLWTPTSTTSAASVQPSLHTPTSSLSTNGFTATSPSQTLSAHQQQKTNSLPTLTTETQTLLTSLDAKLTRLTSTLTQLTDDILRSGSRLSYEVEILRADAGTLDEALRGRSSSSFARSLDSAGDPELDEQTKDAQPDTGAEGSMRTGKGGVERPAALETLHTLTLLRQRLQTVIKTFDLALAWPLPPSALSGVPSGLMSVTAPSSRNGNGVNGSEQDPEAKGQAFENRVREEVQELLEDGEEGVRLAREKVEEMRGLCVVWKGTVEERARMRFVEGLGRMVDDFEDGGG